MIKSIRLVNWRSHADSVLEFRKGTNLLVGIMGAGKSSVLEGISFGLFGTFPALERRKLKQDDIVRLSEPEAKVVLGFEWDGSEYRVERSIERSKKGTSSAAEIYKDGTLAEHGSVAVNSYIEQLTGVDYDLFTRAIYSEQNNIDHFLNLDPRRRKEELDRLLGLDRFETARANIVSVINRIRLRREALEERLSRERMAELESGIKAREDEAAASESALKSAEASLSRISGEYPSVMAGYEAMRKSREESERLSKEEVRLQARCEALSKELEGKEAPEPLLKEIQGKLTESSAGRAKLQAGLKELDERRTHASRELGSIEARLKSASEARGRLASVSEERREALGGKTLQELERAQKESEHRALSSDSERKSLEREAASLEESVKALSPGLSKCPVCDASLTGSGIAHVRSEKEAIISRDRSRAAELAASAAAARKESDSLLASMRKAALLSERIASLEKECAEASGLPARKAELEAASASLSAQRKAAEEKIEAVSSECERFRAESSALQVLIARKKEFAEASGRLAETRSQLSALRFDAAAFEGIRTKAEGMRLEAEKLNSEKTAAGTRLRMCREMLAALRDELARMRSIENDIRGLYSLEEQLTIYRSALAETQVGLRASLSEAINSAMNEIWAIFYPYKNYHGLRLTATDKDYVFEVNDGSAWKGLETVASGGERASAALALRVALAMILTPKLSWLVLDEPTHNLDAEAVELLSSALQFKVPEVVNQTFVITHDEAFMGSDFAASYRLVRDKGRNGETKIEPM
jgi:exonuclease SbcC